MGRGRVEGKGVTERRGRREVEKSCIGTGRSRKYAVRCSLQLQTFSLSVTVIF